MEKTLLMLERNSFSSNLSTFKNKTYKRVIKLSSLLVMSLLLLLSPILVSAQAVSGVTGVITDPSGAVVPGVQVVLLDTKTSRELTTTSNDQGVYVFNNVSPGGGYRLTFTGAGFQTTVLNDVQLGIGRTETHDAQLTAGNVSATVEIESTAGDVTLNTTDPSVGNVIGERQLRELPIQIRGTPASLIGLQPGAIGNNVGTGNVNRVGSVTGSRADQGNVTVDGIDANDQTGNFAFATVANAPIDSVQEFRAVTANPSASEGRSSGGQVQLATKSGTNDYHGNTRIYYRGDKFAANEFFNNRNGVARPLLQRRQFGGSLGGPLHFLNFGEGGSVVKSGRDRLFFFLDFEGRRDDSQVSSSRTVPLQHFREGRIAYIRATDAVTGAVCPATTRIDNNPNCVGYLSQAEIRTLDPRGIGVNQPLLSFINSRYPLANDLTGGNGINTGLFRFNVPNQRADNILTTRIDGNINDKQKVFGRVTYTRRDSTNSAAYLPGDPDAVLFKDRSRAWVVGHSWVISPSFFNQATFGVTKQVNFFTPAESPAFPNSFTFGAGLDSPFPSMSYQDRYVTVPTIRDDATWTKGAHTFQFGTMIKPIKQTPGLTNDFNFVGLGIGGNTTALNATLRPTGTNAVRAGSVAGFDSAFAFILGRYATINTNYVYSPEGTPSAPGTGRTRDYAYNEYEFYVQDNWKIRSDLTLNLGVRYHLYPAPYETRGFQSGTNIEDFDALLERRAQNAANGIGGIEAEPILTYSVIGKGNNKRPFYETDKNNFAPRIGFAYNPSFKNGLLGAIFGERQTSLRGGYSLVYDRPAGAITFLLDQYTYIFDSSNAINFGNAADPRAALLNDPRFTGFSLPVQNTAPSVTQPVAPFVTNGVPRGLILNQGNYVIDKDFEIPYSHQWSFGIQRELPLNMLLDVTYVGRRGRKLWTQADSAQALNFKDPASGQLLFDALNAIQPTVQQQVANGVQSPVISNPQPWFENQIRLAPGGAAFCAANAATSCTQAVVNSFREQVRLGGTAQVIRGLAQVAGGGALRPNVGMSAQFALNDFVTNQGFSNYDGMLVSLQKRFSQGLTFDANYTWSHAIDNQSSVTNTGFGGTIQDVFNPKASRANADFDIRHLFNANYVWEVPVGRKRAIGSDMPHWLDAVIGGWNFSGIFTARSGVPINAASGAFTLQLGVGNPSVVIGDPKVAFKSDIRDEAGGIQFFADPAAARAALRFPRHGEIGTRNAFRSPSFWNMDMAVSKKFRMPWSENHQLTLRAEGFNVFNNVMFDAPSSLGIESATFGRILGTLSSARDVQFAIRYDF